MAGTLIFPLTVYFITYLFLYPLLRYGMDTSYFTFITRYSHFEGTCILITYELQEIITGIISIDDVI